ncbi:MAG: putative Ig domain-containing protein, partial [Magnetococcales bacterium]|nr:putative Ig domain-containing protein [Magnetococcales bacterium]
LSGGAPLPGWLSYDPSTGALLGTPAAAGVYDLRVTATDSAQAVAAYGFRLVTTYPNRVPVVTAAITDQAATQDAPFGFHLPDQLFNDPDGNATLTLHALTLDGKPLPSWLTFDAQTGMFSGTPGNGDTGKLSVRVTATDDAGAQAATLFSINVANVNDPPILAHPVADQNAFQDRLFRLVLPENTFTDADGDALIWHATDLTGNGFLPSWLSFDASTRSLTGTPAQADRGVVNLKITATDPSGKVVADTFRITVQEPDLVPTLAKPLADLVATEDQSFLFRIPDNTFADLTPNDILSISVTLADNTPLPAWLHYDADTHVLSGTPTNGDVGIRELRVTATDKAGESVADLVTLSVANVNDAPTLVHGIHDQQVLVNQAFVFALPVNTFADVDVGDHLTLKAGNLTPGVALPSWLTFDAATGVFSGVPTLADLGTTYIKVSATDAASASVADVFTLQVVKTLSGTLLDSEVAGVHFATATQTGETSAAGVFHFMPGEAITFSIGDIVLGNSVAGETLTPVDLAGHGDWEATTNLLRFLQTLDENHNPEDGIAITQAARDAAVGVQLDFSQEANDFADSSVLKSYLAAATGQTALVTTDAAWSHFQNTLIQVSASSGEGVLSTSPADPTAIEDRAFVYQLPLSTFFPGMEQATLTATTLTGASLPSWLLFDAQTGLFAGTPTNADVGVTAIRVTAENASHETLSRVIPLHVVNVNDAPQLQAVNTEVIAIQNEGFQSGIVAAMFKDVDPGEKLVYGISAVQGSALPSWLSFDAGSGTLTGKPVVADTQGVDLLVSATDQVGAKASGVIHLKILDPNLPPTFSGSLEGITATEDAPFNHSLAGLFTDPEGGKIQLAVAPLNEANPLPAWLSFDSDTRLLTGQPGNGDVGAFPLRVTATDPSGKTLSIPFTITVSNVNDAPTLEAPLVFQTVTQGTAFKYQLPTGGFVDSDPGDVLALSATLANGNLLPAWLSFDATTATFTGTPGGEDLGSLSVRVTATDVAQSAVSGSFQIDVTRLKHAPVLDGKLFPSDVVIQEDHSLVLTLPAETFTDADPGDKLTLEARGINGEPLPAWLRFDAGTRTFYGTPDNAQAGLTTIRITATDPGGLATTGSFNLTVANVNDAPVVVEKWPKQILTLNQKFLLQVPKTLFADVDAGDHLAYSIGMADGKALPAWLSFDAETGSFLGTPVGAPGIVDIKLTVTDLSGSRASEWISLRLVDASGIPQFNPFQDQTAFEDRFFHFTVPASLYSDPDADPLTLTASGLPSWLTF